MQIKLNPTVIYAERLEYDEALKLCKIIFKHPISKFIRVYMESGPNKIKWSVVGRVKEINKLFLKNPESFYIEL